MQRMWYVGRLNIYANGGGGGLLAARAAGLISLLAGAGRHAVVICLYIAGLDASCATSAAPAPTPRLCPRACFAILQLLASAAGHTSLLFFW